MSGMARLMYHLLLKTFSVWNGSAALLQNEMLQWNLELICSLSAPHELRLSNLTIQLVLTPNSSHTDACSVSLSTIVSSKKKQNWGGGWVRVKQHRWFMSRSCPVRDLNIIFLTPPMIISTLTKWFYPAHRSRPRTKGSWPSISIWPVGSKNILHSVRAASSCT